MHYTAAVPQPAGLTGWLMGGGFFGDTIQRSDGASVMDGVAAGATLGGLAGVIFGSAYIAGPVTLGVLGILGGGLVGYLLDLVIHRDKRKPPGLAGEKASTLVLVDCESPARADGAEQVLRENQAREIGRTG